jgi:hypothetical protein
MKNLKNTLPQIKKIGLVILATITLISCTPNDPNGNPTGVTKLLSIKSTNMPSGNSCNVWDLQESPITSLSTYTTVRSGDNIVSSPVLLGQTTMSNQTSTWDKINNQYVVSIGTSVLFYDYSSGTPTSPTNFSISGSNYVEGVASTGGNIYFLTRHKDIDFYNAGSPIIISSSAVPVALTSHVSNITDDPLNNLYFISEGKLFKYAVTTTTATGSSITISGSSLGDKYNGVEYNSSDSKIYAVKRNATGTQDDFVRIDPSTGIEIILSTTGGIPYAKDYSRISATLDYTTNTYYIASSDGHSSNTHTITAITNITTIPSFSTPVTSSQYVFGLQFKD